uniref:Bromo domain-containing protein n=1 Tax=Hyaloperonospora arabidopsidis (strain Emoy2) TaxID=559515 RepID=M4B7Z2_HYAAE
MISEVAHLECVRLLELLTNARVQESWSWVFMTPVDIPGYDQVIKKPMDLGTITKNLGSKPSRCRFKSHEKFARDVRLVFNNALVYNKDDQDVKGSVYAAAQHLLRVFETAYTKAIDSVLKVDDVKAAAEKEAHRETKKKKRRKEEEEKTKEKKEETSHYFQSSSSGSSSSKLTELQAKEGEKKERRDDGEGEDEGSKHRHKHQHKKDKKAKKKSKKKSKDRDRDREKTRHSSSRSGENKKKAHRSDHLNQGAAPRGSGAENVVEGRTVTVSKMNDVTPPATTGSVIPPSSSVVVKQEPVADRALVNKMLDSEVAVCLALIMRLIKYKDGNISPAAPFLQPVDVTHFPDYRIKVPNRMHLYGVQKKLRSGSYSTIDAFAYDVRLIFSNCLVYNSDVIVSKVMRNHAVTLMKLFESQFAKIGGSWPGIPERWKCHQIIHDVLAHRTDGQETAQWFKYPIEAYYDAPDQIPYNYYETVKEPMDIGSVSSRLHLGKYKHVSEFVVGLKLVFDNCIRYWKSDSQGQTYCKSAETLLNVLHARSAVLISSSNNADSSREKQQPSSTTSSKDKSPHPSSGQQSSTVMTSVPNHEGEATTKKALSSSKSSKNGKTSKSSKSRESSGGLPEKGICLGIMKQLRGHKMKGYGGIEIKTAGPFLTAVDTTKYTDYLAIVSEPMDFAKIERKLRSDRYGSVDEFSADVHLIFSNCHKYNSDPVEGADIRAMATNLRTYFVKLCNEKLGPLDGMVNGPNGSPTHTSIFPSFPAASEPKLAVSAGPIEANTCTATAGKGYFALQKAMRKSPNKDLLSTPSVVASSSASPTREPKKDKSASRSKKEAKADCAGITTLPPVAPLEPAVLGEPEPTALLEAPSCIIKKEVSRDSTNSAGLTIEEAKRLRKEMKVKRKKEKREKKEKKKKDKEKKREKKERSKILSSVPQESKLPSQGSSTAVSVLPHLASAAVAGHASPAAGSATLAAGSASLAAGSATPAAGSATPAAGPAAPTGVPPATAPAAIASKRGLLELHGTASSVPSKKSKRHKKSDLTSWETSCERVLNRLGKIEQVVKLHFNHPLLEVFPHLASEYTALITEPMDLRTLREQLHAHALTQAEFLRKGRLIFRNAVKFNCADDPASIQVRNMSAHLLWYFDSLCAELQIYPAPGEQSRAKRYELRRERVDVVNAVPVELKAKECQKLLRVLNSQKHDKNCWPFRKPVRVLFPALSPDYFDIIKTPMDLSTIAGKLNEFEYKSHGEFIRDMRLTFENAMVYNRADKDREGWSVYSAASHMLAVVEDLWGDVTLEVTEKTRRRELLRKERMNESKRRRTDVSDVSGEREDRVHKHNHLSTGESESGHKHGKHQHEVSGYRVEEGAGVASIAASAASSTSMPPKSPGFTTPGATSHSVVGTIVVGSGSGLRDDNGGMDATATRVKLQLMPNRPNMERMNKQERKAEEKRRKRARREEEMARTEKRRRTAVAATDDALREAEIRSRRKQLKLEMAEAVRLREERDRRVVEEEAERVRRAQMKLNAAAWTGVLVPAGGAASSKRRVFWAKKHLKLQIPPAFQPPAINA